MSELKSGNVFRTLRLGRKRLLILALALMAIALAGALYGLTVHQDNAQELNGQSNSQDGIGLSVSDKPSSINVIMGDEAPRLTEILKQINDTRAANGVSSVTESEILDRSAAAKANDMINKNYWSHNAPDGTEPWVFIRQAGYRYHDAGENLWNGHNAYTVTSDWLNSPTHKAVMLDARYTEIGIAIQKATSYIGQKDVYVVVTHYASPVTDSANSYTSSSSNISTNTNSNNGYEIPSYSSTPPPTFDRPSPTFTPPPQQCVGNTDSSYSC